MGIWLVKDGVEYLRVKSNYYQRLRRKLGRLGGLWVLEG